MRAAKIDRNHNEIIETLRALGFAVFSTATVGRGFPDLALSRNGNHYLAEVKNGKLGWKHTEQQKTFMARWKAKIPVFDSVDSVIAWERNLNARG